MLFNLLISLLNFYLPLFLKRLTGAYSTIKNSPISRNVIYSLVIYPDLFFDKGELKDTLLRQLNHPSPDFPRISLPSSATSFVKNYRVQDQRLITFRLPPGLNSGILGYWHSLISVVRDRRDPCASNPWNASTPDDWGENGDLVSIFENCTYAIREVFIRLAVEHHRDMLF